VCMQYVPDADLVWEQPVDARLLAIDRVAVMVFKGPRLNQ
jgi:hypothetical protein